MKDDIKKFGKLKAVFNEIMIEGIIRKDTKRKDLFKKYVKLIKENPALKAQFIIYNNLENKVEPNLLKATLFLQENLALLQKFTKKQLLEANLLLLNPILFEQEVKTALDSLHDDIATLVFTEKNAKNIEKIVEATNNIINHIMNNKPKEVNESVDLPNSMLTTIYVDKYNEKYSELNESDRELVKAFIEADDEKKLDLYKGMIRECIDSIDERFGDADVDTKDKLLRVKDKLLNDKVEITENFDKDIAKLLGLKNDLLG